MGNLHHGFSLFACIQQDERMAKVKMQSLHLFSSSLRFYRKLMAFFNNDGWFWRRGLLRQIQGMEYIRDDFKWEARAKTPLRVIIIGAGMGGLTAAIGLKRAGHHVIVLEQVANIKEVGAGIQIAPNASRILNRFGLLEKVMEHANILERNSIRRYDDEELGTVEFMPAVGKEYGAPLAVVHRGDLQRILLEAANKEGVEIWTNAKVLQVDDTFDARVQLIGGDWIEGDVVVAADGIKSNVRRQMSLATELECSALPTGDAAYRILIPRERMEHDPEALALLESQDAVRWMGPGGHIMAYPIKNNTVYNVVLIHPQSPTAPAVESWTHPGSKSAMLSFYSHWNPLIARLLTYAPTGNVKEWTLNVHPPLSTWHLNRVTLLGDACHPMLPYVAQGAANAIEDAGVLAVCLSLVESKEDVGLALEMYERVRKERAEKIQGSAVRTGETLHLADGEEQRRRDEKIRGAGRKGRGENPDLWSDRKWQGYMWGVDVMKEAMEGWARSKEGVELNEDKEMEK